MEESFRRSLCLRTIYVITSVLADSVIAELKAGEFDQLEKEYQEFSGGERQPSGPLKSSIYFWVFERGPLSQASLEEADAIVQEVRDWLAKYPGSVPGSWLMLMSSWENVSSFRRTPVNVNYLRTIDRMLS